MVSHVPAHLQIAGIVNGNGHEAAEGRPRLGERGDGEPRVMRRWTALATFTCGFQRWPDIAKHSHLPRGPRWIRPNARANILVGRFTRLGSSTAQTNGRARGWGSTWFLETGLNDEHAIVHPC